MADTADDVSIVHLPGQSKIVAVHGGSPVGYLSYAEGPLSIGIDMLHVRPTHRGQGIAARLLDHAQEVMPRKPLVTDDASEAGRAFLASYEKRTGTKVHVLDPGSWW